MDQWEVSVFNDSTELPGDDKFLVTVREGEANSQTFALVLFAATVVISLLTVAGNSVLMATYLHFRSLRKAQTDFVISLTVANLLVGVTAPYIMLRRFQFLMSPPPNVCECLFRLVLTLMVVSCSACNLCAATADRYVAIMYPLRYSKIMTRVRTRTIIVFLWIYNLGFSLIPLVGLYDRDFPFCNFKMLNSVYAHSLAFFNIFVPIVTSVVLYVPIIVTTRRHLRQIKMQGLTLGHVAQNVNKKVVQEARIALTTALILGGFVLCWLPLLVFPYIGHLLFSDMFSITKLNSVAILLSFSHSALCPVIYGWRNRDFREGLLKMFGEIKKWLGAVRERFSDTLRLRFLKLYLLRIWPWQLKKPTANAMSPKTPTTSEESLASADDEHFQHYVFPKCKFCS